MTDLEKIDAPPELRQTVAACVKWSQENIIANSGDYQSTADHLQEIKAQLKAADAFFDGPIKTAHELHKTLVARKKIVTDPLRASESLDKGKMLWFAEDQKRRAEEERRRLQAIADERARKEREIAEQAAAKQRAIEAEQRAKVEAARVAEEKARREAEAASATERKRLLAEAEASRKEAEKAERAAAAAAVKVEAAEDKAALVEAPVIAVAAPVPKVSGITTRRTWKATVVDLPAFLEFVFNSRRADLVTVNQAVLDALAKGLREAASMPGVKFEETSIMSSRS